MEMEEFVRGLTINAALLLIICVVFIILYTRIWKRKVIYNILLGVVIGFVGIAILYNTVELEPGIVFDTRTILTSISGMFFGFVPTVIGTVAICLYRVFLGGPGVYMGVLTTVSSAVIGILWKKVRWAKIQKSSRNWPEFYLFGLIAHAVMLACVWSLPAPMVGAVFNAISLPVIIVFPVVSLIICVVMNDSLSRIHMKEDLEASEMYLRTVIDQAPLGIFIGSREKTILVNHKFEKIVGRSKSELESMSWEEYTHREDIQKDRQQFEKVLGGEIDSYELDKRYVRPDGSIVWAHMILATLRLHGRNQDHHICMVQEITDTILAREKLQKSEARYKALYHEYESKQSMLVCLLNSIPDMIFCKDTASRFIGCNQAFERFIGKEEDGIIGKSDDDFFDSVRADWYRQCDAKALQANEPYQFEEEITSREGAAHCYETIRTPFYDASRNTLGLVGICRDISERKKKEKEIEYLSYHDALTGLNNRAFFESEKARLDTEKNLPLSVITGDINGLKLINDAFGHDEGDRILIAAANILQSCARKNDVAARIGGDEFCVLLPNTDEEALQAVVEQIRNASLLQPMEVPREMSFSSLSLGCATKYGMDEHLDKVIQTAEQKMYRRKLLEHKSLHSTIITSIKTVLMEKSFETREHCDRLADFSYRLGREVGLKEEELVALELLSELHDIGKISVDTKILTKPDALTRDEWTEIKKHPEAGYRIARTLPELNHIADYILAHHERWDGKGYPQGLAGEQIPMLSRIITIVDSFDAMTNDRAYRKAKSVNEAVEEIKREAGRQFDPQLAEVFVEIVAGTDQQACLCFP